MSGTKAMLHDQVCSVTRGLEKSPSLSQANSSLTSAHGNLVKGTKPAKAKAHTAHGKKTHTKLGKAQRM